LCAIIIEELEKIRKATPTTDHFIRARIVNGMKQSKRELAKTQAEYNVFKKYNVRTAISK
jgi:hypothetical protein